MPCSVIRCNADFSARGLAPPEPFLPTASFYMKANPVLGVQPDFTPWFMVPTNYAKMFEACGAIGIRVEGPDKIKSTVAAAFEQAHQAIAKQGVIVSHQHAHCHCPSPPRCPQAAGT